MFSILFLTLGIFPWSGAPDAETHLRNYLLSTKDFQDGTHRLVQIVTVETPDFWGKILRASVDIKTHDYQASFDYAYLIRNQEIFELSGWGSPGGESFAFVEHQDLKNKLLLCSFSSGSGIISDSIACFSLTQDGVLMKRLPLFYHHSSFRLEQHKEAPIKVIDVDSGLVLGELKLGGDISRWVFKKNRKLPKDLARSVRWEKRHASQWAPARKINMP